MEPVLGLDLEQIVKQAEEESMSEKSLKISATVRGILLDLEKWGKEKEAKLREAKELEGRALAAREKLNRIRQGDWNSVKLQEKEESK